MAISYVDAATYNSGGASVATAPLVIPSTVQAGDLLIAEMSWGVNGTSHPLATPSGWTLRDTINMSTSVLLTGFYWRIAQAGDAGTTVNFALSTAAARQATGTMHVYRGVDQTTPFDSTDVTTNVSTSGNPDAGDNTSVTANAMAFLVAISYYSSQATAATATTPAGWTVRASTGTTAATARKQVFVYEKALPSTGTNTGPVVTMSTTPNASESVHAILRPAATGSHVTKTATLSYDVSSLVREMTFPHTSAHRGGFGAEEALATYDWSYAIHPSISGEGDVTTSSDGVLFAIHDDTLDRTADASSPIKTGNVSSYTAAQLDTVKNAPERSGESPQFLARWSAILDKYKPGTGTPRILCIEVKGDSTQATALCDLIVAKNMAGQVIVNCSTRAVAQVVQTYGIESMFQTNLPNYTNLLADGVKHLSVGSGSVDSSFCTTAHANGIKVWAYTPNTTAARDTLIAAGCDAWFTDRPDILFAGTHVSKTGTISYNTLLRNSRTGSATYDVLQRGTKVGTLSFDTGGHGSRTGAVLFDTLARGSRSGTVSYTTLGRGSRTGALSFDVLQRLVTTGTLSYDTLLRNTKTATLSFNVLTRGGKTATISFNVGSRGIRTGTISYNTNARVSRTGSILFDVDGAGAGRIFKNATLSFDVLGREGRTGVLSYDVQLHGTKSKTLSYDVLERAIKTGTISYQVMSTGPSLGIQLYFSDGGTLVEIGQIFISDGVDLTEISTADLL